MIVTGRFGGAPLSPEAINKEGTGSMKCRACESPNRPGARFCHRCSAPLSPSCIGCGAPLTTAGELCPTCRTERIPEPIAEELFVDEDPSQAPGGAAEIPLSARKTSYTGRASVLETLQNAYEHASSEGELRFVLLVGEPGMGKSRTLKELARRLKTDHPDTRLLVGGGERGAVRFGPFAQLLAARFGLVPNESTDESRDKIIAEIGEVMPATKVTEVAHLLAHLMGLSFPDSPVVEPLVDTPSQLEARTFIALRRFLDADAAEGPLVLCLENLELCGAETVNLLNYLAAGLRPSPILIAGTARASLFDRHPNFGEGEGDLTRVDLAALSEGEAIELWQKLTEPLETAPAELDAHVVKLGSSPRAIYELVHYLLESGIITGAGTSAWKVDARRLADMTLPETHESLVAARVQMMPESDRDVLEKASVIGESFWLDAVVSLLRVDSLSGADPDGPTLSAIAAAGDHTRTHVAKVLARLAHREWLVESPHSMVAGEREFRFAYPHLWSSVYDSVSDERRRRYHKLVAQWLELRPGGRSPLSQEDVAAHLELAGEQRAAAVRYRRAADAARRHFGNDLAIRLYARALSCLGEADLAARIHLWHDLGSVYELVGDYEAALGGFERMLRLAWVCASRTKAAVAFNKMGRVWRRKGDLKLALEYLERGHELFEQARDGRGIAGSLDDIGQVLYLLGRYDEAFVKVTAGLNLRGKGGDARSIAHSLSNLGNIQKDRGNVAAAQKCHEEALVLRREAGDRSGVISSHNNLAVLSYERGDYEEASKGWEQALHEAEDIGALPLQALALCNLGELALVRERLEEARVRLEEGLDLAEEVDDRRLQVEATRNLALLEQHAGDNVRARELAFHAHEVAASAGLREFEGKSLLTLGEVLGGVLFDADKTDEFVAEDSGEMPRAETFFARGVDLLREIGNDAELAKGLESFGRYKIEHGDTGGGKAMLKEALEIFSRLGAPQANEVRRTLGSV